MQLLSKTDTDLHVQADSRAKTNKNKQLQKQNIQTKTKPKKKTKKMTKTNPHSIRGLTCTPTYRHLCTQNHRLKKIRTSNNPEWGENCGEWRKMERGDETGKYTQRGEWEVMEGEAHSGLKRSRSARSRNQIVAYNTTNLSQTIRIQYIWKIFFDRTIFFRKHCLYKKYALLGGQM